MFLPDEQREWFPAAYCDPSTGFCIDSPIGTCSGSGECFDYPVRSNALPTCAAPGAEPQRANCGNAVGDLTPVGSYPSSAGPYGTFDQAGNVWEWMEFQFSPASGPASFKRWLRGGSFSDDVARSGRTFRFAAESPVVEKDEYGFRVAAPYEEFRSYRSEQEWQAAVGPVSEIETFNDVPQQEIPQGGGSIVLDGFSIVADGNYKDSIGCDPRDAVLSPARHSQQKLLRNDHRLSRARPGALRPADVQSDRLPRARVGVRLQHRVLRLARL